MKTKREKQTEDLLLSQYSRYYRLAYSYVHNEQDALDIVQESALQSHAGLPQRPERRLPRHLAVSHRHQHRFGISAETQAGRYGRGGDRTAYSSRGGLHQ